MKNVSWHEIIKVFDGTGLVKLLRYCGIKALRGNSRISKLDLQYVILNLFQDLKRFFAGAQNDKSTFPRPLWERKEFLNERSEFRNSGEGSEPFANRKPLTRICSSLCSHNCVLSHKGRGKITDKKAAFTLAEGATHVDMSDNIRRVAFTLAEVLITLGIIGVVAAMTIPTLVSSYKKKIVETRLVKVYSTFNQAIKMSEAENGPLTTWDTIDETSEWVDGVGAVIGESNISDWFDKYLAPYIKVLKVEKNTSNKDKKINVYMPDGSLVMISGNSWLVWPDANDFEATELGEDTDMTNRNIDDCGTKYFTFYFNPRTSAAGAQKYHYAKPLEPFLWYWDGTEEMLRNDDRLGCREESVSNERAYCTQLIRMNNWKIPDDYPLKF